MRPFLENRRIHICVSRSSPELRHLRIEPLESRMLLSVIHWDGGPSGTGTSWADAENWEGDVLPSSTDDVDIAAGATVIHDSGEDTIHRLVSAAAFTLSGGTLTVSSTVAVNNVFTISGGTLSQATVLRGSSGQSIMFTKGAADAGAALDGVTTSCDLDLASIDGANVLVVNGLTLNNATVYLGDATGTTYGQMYFTNTETLGGTGTVLFGKHDYNGFTTGKDATLTIGPDITVHGSRGALGNPWNGSGTIINQGTINADGTGGTITINPSTFQNKGKLIASGETLTIVGLQHLGGDVQVNEGATMNVSGSLTIDGGGTFSIASGATFKLEGDLAVNGMGALPSISGGQWHVTGDLRGDTTNADAFAQATVIFYGQGTESSPQWLEVMSQDRGNISTGPDHNFAYGSLTIDNATYVRLVDDTPNASVSATNAEALYVEDLNVGSGCTLDLNGFHVYARSYQNNGTVNGEISVLPPDGAIATSTSITSDHTSDSVYGDSVAIIATVSGNGAATPTGSVQFVIDQVDYDLPVILSDGVASIEIATLGAGEHQIAAIYTSDDSEQFADSETDSPLAQNVAKATLTVRAEDKSKALGASLPEFTVLYSGFANDESLANSGVTGAPSFSCDATAESLVGTYPITVGLGTLTAQNYTFKFEPGTLTVVPVTPIATSTSIASDHPSGSRSGEVVAFTATISVDGAATPTGTVQFIVDQANYGQPVTLSDDGTASIEIATLGAGTHQIAAIYESDNPQFADSETDSPLTQIVGQAPFQMIFASPDTRNICRGQSFGFTVQYSTSDNDSTLKGLGLRMHFNSSIMTFNGFYNSLTTAIVAQASQDDILDYDGDASTDKYVLVTWDDVDGNWPNVSLPVTLFQPKFTIAESSLVGTTTKIKFTASSTAASYQFCGRAVTVQCVPVNLDVNGDGAVTDNGDGMPILKYMFGFRDSSIISPDIVALLDKAVGQLSNPLNPDGSSDKIGDALSDGNLIRRYALGGHWKGSDLVRDVLIPGDPLTSLTWDQIWNFLDSFNPMVPTGEPAQFAALVNYSPEENLIEQPLLTTVPEVNEVSENPITPETTETIVEKSNELPQSVLEIDPAVVPESPKMLVEVAPSENEILPQAAVSNTAGHQIVTPDPITQTVVPGDPVTLHVRYTTDPVDASLTGLGLCIHYNSQLIKFDELSDVLGTNLVREQPPVADNDDFDHDPTTDKYLLISWADIVSNWPGEIPITLLTAHWDSSPQAQNSTVVNFTSSSTVAGWDSKATPAVIHFQQIIANSSISGYVLAENGDPRFKPAEMGLPGVTVVLTSTTSAGTLTVTTMTDDNGAFRFSNLPPGIYQIAETHPAAVLAGGTDGLVVTLGSNDNRQGVIFYDGWFKPQYVSVRNLVSNRPPLGAPGSAVECRNLIARGEELAGNIAQAALIRQGGANTSIIFTPAPVKEQVDRVAKTDQATAKTNGNTQTAAAPVAIAKNHVELSTTNALPLVTVPNQNVIVVGAQQNPPLSNDIASAAAAIQVASYPTGNAVASPRIPIARPIIIEPAIVAKNQPNVSPVFANETVMSVVPAVRVETTVKQNSTTVVAAISTVKPAADLASITKTSQSLDNAIHGLFCRVGKFTTESGTLESWVGNGKKALCDLAKDDHSQHVSRPVILQYQNDEDKLDLATDFEFDESIAGNYERDRRPIKRPLESLFEKEDNWLDI